MKINGRLAARGAISGKIVSALNRFSLKSLLFGSAGLIILFCILVVVSLRVSQGITFEMMNRLITVDHTIADLCLKSNAAMIDARRLEKDFLLNYREFGFDESRSRYITRLFTSLADIAEYQQRIRGLASGEETMRRTQEVERALDRYRRGVELLVERYGERGFFDTGVSGQMRAEALGLEGLVRRQDNPQLLVGLLLVRRAEHDFIEHELDVEAAAFQAALRDFRTAVARLPATATAGIRAGAERYLERFREYVQLTEEIRKIKKEYLKSVQIVDPHLEQLYVTALNNVALKQRAIEESSRRLSLPIFVGGGLVLVVTALFSLFVAFTVTRSVAESRAFAERIASGDLGSRIAPAGQNEFFSLGTALNTMAESLHQAEVSRRKGIAALRESEENYRSFVETSTDWIWAIDRAGRHTFSNDRVRSILGIAPGELLKSATPELLHPEDVPRVRELLANSVAVRTGWQGLVLRWRHKDGSYRWLESNAVPVTDAQGNFVGFRGVDRDITERRRLESELIKTQKLEAIGTLAGGIAHDFNNLLQGLFGYITLARLSLDQSDKAAELLGQAERALSLSVNLTTQLLTFAKGGKPQMRRIALPEILEDPVKFALSGSRSTYRIVVDEALQAVDADAGQLSQVIQNLVLNASEAMPQGGLVEIVARNEVLAAEVNPLVPAGGDFVRIEVRDSGAGISGQHLARIFDPYFTTKQKGSGLGLATAYSIVRNHNGFIDVSSHPGAGSIFSVYLPASRAGEQPPAPAAGIAHGKAAGRVLLMDDDALVRGVAAKMIAALGHAVEIAANGEEALELFRGAEAAGHPFDVVILDLTVKNGLGGEETVRRLREIAPDVTAVVSSGYSDAAALADYRSYGFAASLNKPYRLDALRECLLALLQSSGAGPAGGAGTIRLSLTGAGLQQSALDVPPAS